MTKNIFVVGLNELNAERREIEASVTAAAMARPARHPSHGARASRSPAAVSGRPASRQRTFSAWTEASRSSTVRRRCPFGWRRVTGARPGSSSPPAPFAFFARRRAPLL